MIPVLLIIALTSGALHALGLALDRTAVLPWAVGLRVLLAAVPMAFATWMVAHLIDRRSRREVAAGAQGFACGAAIVIFWPSAGLPLAVAAVLVVLAVVGVGYWPSRNRWTVGYAVLAFAFLMLAVHDLNYLLLVAAGHRLQDPALRALDLWMYGWVMSRPYEGIFPILKSQWIFRLLENGYLTLSFQPVLALVALVADGRSPVRFFGAVGVCYAVATVVFLVFPAIGPMLFFPDSFDPRFSNSLTHAITVALRADVVALRQGLAPVSGLGYFIALPSIHAAIATVCQVSLWYRPTLFWMLVPMNVSLLAATFLLGQHYIVDTMAGMLLGVGAALYCGLHESATKMGLPERREPEAGVANLANSIELSRGPSRRSPDTAC